MRVRQYAYFVFSSKSVTPEEIERRLGMAGDQIDVKGGRGKDPLRPVQHSWRIASSAGFAVDEQIASVPAPSLTLTSTADGYPARS